MARESESRQQEQARQILYDDAHPHSVSGRPRARGVHRAGRQPAGRQPAKPQPVQQEAPAPRQRPPQQRTPRQQPVRQPQPQPQQLFEESYEDSFDFEDIEEEEAVAGQPRPQPRSRARSFEQAAYSGGSARARTQVKEPKPKRKGGAVTWLLVLVVLLLLAVAGYLVFLLFNGGLGNLSLGGDKAGQKSLTSGGVLAETADAGEGYVGQTIFIGDSNFERLREYGLVDAGTVAAKVGIGAGAITSDAFIEVTGQNAPLTIAQTMAAVGPTRLLVMMGTNDVPNMSVEEYTAAYKASLEELRKSAPNADIVVAAIPPVADWKDSEMLNASAVRQFNEALLAMCEAEGYPYLNVYEALANESGYLPESYTDDGYHLTQEALEKLLQYYRTHAHNP